MADTPEIPLLETQVSALSALEEARKLILAGEATEALVVLVGADGDYRFAGGFTVSRTRMAGILLDAAVSRLGYAIAESNE